MKGLPTLHLYNFRSLVLIILWSEIKFYIFSKKKPGDELAGSKSDVYTYAHDVDHYPLRGAAEWGHLSEGTNKRIAIVITLERNVLPTQKQQIKPVRCAPDFGSDTTWRVLLHFSSTNSFIKLHILIIKYFFIKEIHLLGFAHVFCEWKRLRPCIVSFFSVAGWLCKEATGPQKYQ